MKLFGISLPHGYDDSSQICHVLQLFNDSESFALELFIDGGQNEDDRTISGEAL